MSTSTSTDFRPGPIPATHIRVAVGAGLTTVALAITLTALSFFTAAVLADHPGWTIASFTLYYMIYGLASAAAMPLAAQLLPRFGSRRLLIGGGLIAALGLVGFSLSTDLWMFYAAALVIGVGVGLSVQFVPIVLINRWFIARRAFVLGLVLAGTGVGGAIFAQALPPLISAIGWQLSMVVLAVTMVVFTALPAMFLIHNEPEDLHLRAYGAGDRPGGPGEPLPAEQLPGLTQKQALRTPWVYVLFVAVALMGVVHAMNQHLVTYMQLQPYGITVSAASISIALTVVTLSLVVFKPALGWLIDKLGLERALILTLGIAAIVAFGSAFVQHLWVYVLCMIGLALGFANGTVSPPLITAHAFGQRDFPALWGILGAAYPIGTAVGAPLWGVVKDATGSYGWGFVSVPVVSALFLAGMIVVMRRGRALWFTESTITR